MLINTFLDTEDFVHLYYPEDEPAAAQGCSAGARMAPKYPPRPPSPEYSQASSSSSEMSDRERYRAPPPPEPPPHRVRAVDLYPRLRTHYDEPGLDVPFTPICGEFVQWVGRLADGGIIAMSNYRLHAQPRRRSGPGSSVPLRVIDALETRDLVHLIVLCKNGRQLTCSFGSGDECVEWWRRLTAALAPLTAVQDTFAAAYAAWAKEQPPSSVHRALLKASNSPHRHWFGPELERLGFTSKGSWRVTAANADYKLCPSYPPLLVVPATICDEELDVVARFRAMRRLPAVVWRHRGTGAVIARSSQPEVGWLGWRNNEDERLLAAYVSACANDRPQTNSHKQVKLLIVDARSYASAVTNRARGGGCECSQYYPLADIQFMCMPNIHHVRRSFHQLRALAAEPPDHANWHSGVERTLWLAYVSGVGRAASVVCRAVLAGRPVLVHCSDGWDRTPQIVAAAQLLLDPHYRTLEGFRVLIEREWLDFGHKFADRCGHQFGPEEPNERSPIFLQWLDWVHQLLLQYPCSFEFNEAYLIKLGTHVHSCMFGTFLCNSVRERREARDTAHVWELLRDPPYRNHLYSPHNLEQVLYPDYNVRSMQVWTSMFGCDRDEQLDEYDEPRAPQDLPRPQCTNGLMTKTRSCDNLLNEGEKRMTQRRCSDPNIAMDVMKLSIVVNDCEARRECRSALTDSCVDELPVLAVAAPRGETPIESDEVDGLHPDHFENKPRDLASDSSSLERELCPPLGAALGSPLGSALGAPLGPGDEPSGEAASPDANGLRPGDGDTPDEPPVFVCDTYTDVIGMAEAAREAGRTRNISITWRSISESSNQSSSERGDSHECSPDNEPRYPQLNGIIDDAKLLDAELNGAGSSESEGEAPRRGSQLTLCPASPRHRLCCCAHAHNGTGWVRGAVRCVCGAGAGRGAPPDGLPPAPDPLQARLHQIILYQRRVVEQLSSELREAREALRQSSPAHPPASPAPAPPLVHEPKCGSAGSGGSADSSSGSGSEVEVGEEARGLVWVPDAAAARCQHCQQPFWLARRRHHCRRCGGLFCGACATREPRAERLCRRCRAHR